MTPLDLVSLTTLMELTRGSPKIKIGLIDGFVVTQHPDLTSENVREIPGANSASCNQTNSAACQHGTFVAGILIARRKSAAPALCPECILIVRPIFAETTLVNDRMPRTTPRELATAIIECMDAGARVINLSVALSQPSLKREQELEDALDQAVKRGVIVVAAAGNQSILGSTAITRHPWVIPVAACNLQGLPMNDSNLGHSIGRRGLTAPGDHITSLGTGSHPITLGGTSVAVPFVTGAIALLWSEFPAAAATDVKLAVSQSHLPRRATVMPPMLNAWSAYQSMRG